MRDGINVVVSAPRRYGKTSLLERATATLTREGATVISVNVLACRNLSTFAARLANGAYAGRHGRWHRLKQAAAAFTGRLRVTPTVTFEGDTPRFAFAATLEPADADKIIEDVYTLMDELAERAPAVIVLDEFQSIGDLGEHLPALFKALADAHPRVSLVLAGSKQHLMERLVGDRGAPLYGLAERISLDALPPTTMSTFLRERARVGGKAMSAEAAARIIELAGPVPNDIQRLAYETYGLAGRTVTVADVEAGLSQAVQHEAAAYADLYGRLSPGQRRVLSALASGPVSEPYSAGFVTGVALANAASVRRALDALTADELVTRRGAAYHVADPFLAAWLSQTL